MATIVLPRERHRLRLPSWWRERRPRAIALAIVALVHLLLLLALLYAARVAPPAGGQRAATVVRLIALPKSAPPKAAKAVTRPVTTPHTQAVKVPIPIVKLPPTDKPAAPLFKTEMFDAVDISKLPSHHTETADAAGTGTSIGPPAAATGEGDYGPVVGTGPHGEKLYAAEWYREPTHAEIAPYLPRHLPDVSTADIICRTIDHFGVEDCQEFGEQPIGTGLSRAIRQAGWQFKVKPVRLGQKFEVGTWVRIHFTITAVPRDDAGG
ncbi:MAG: hypothetical protein JO290_08800 [Sphingomonadaceae bacterium]|nr:hypothetical protein [Sphingomonadaceae bacterium]